MGQEQLINIADGISNNSTAKEKREKEEIEGTRKNEEMEKESRKQKILSKTTVMRLKMCKNFDICRAPGK